MCWCKFLLPWNLYFKCIGNTCQYFSYRILLSYALFKEKRVFKFNGTKNADINESIRLVPSQTAAHICQLTFFRAENIVGTWTTVANTTDVFRWYLRVKQTNAKINTFIKWNTGKILYCHGMLKILSCMRTWKNGMLSKKKELCAKRNCVAVCYIAQI